MIALVTGATGFLGRRVVQCLVEDGADVRCFVRPSSNVADIKAHLGSVLWEKVTIIRGELTDAESVRAALKGIEVVYHLAAGMSGGAPSLVLNTVVPTRVLANACADAGIARFVLVSSLGVYGAGHLKASHTLDETCPVDSKPQLRDAYTFSKIMQEQACRDIARERGLHLVVVRPGVIFGPGRGALSTRFGLTMAGWTLRIGGARLLPYTYVDNCAAAICRAGTAAGAVGETINVLDDDLPSVRDLNRAYRRHGRKLKSLWLPQSAIGPLSGLYEWYCRYSQGQLPDVISRYRTDTFWKPLKYSNRKAKRLLGWAPRVTMADALEAAIKAPASKTS